MWSHTRRCALPRYRGDQYDAAVEFIRLGDIARTLRQAGLPVTQGMEEGLHQVRRVLDGRPWREQ